MRKLKGNGYDARLTPLMIRNEEKARERDKSKEIIKIKTKIR